MHGCTYSQCLYDQLDSKLATCFLTFIAIPTPLLNFYLFLVIKYITENVCKSISLGVQDTAGTLIFTLITKAADAIILRDKFINTYPTSLLTLICDFLTFL